MAIIKTEQGVSDAIATGQEVEVRHLFETTNLTEKQARELLLKFGNDWERIRREAENLKAEK